MPYDVLIASFKMLLSWHLMPKATCPDSNSRDKQHNHTSLSHDYKILPKVYSLKGKNHALFTPKESIFCTSK